MGKVSLRYVLCDVKSAFLIKVGLCPVYRMARKKYQSVLLSCPNIVLAPDIKTFQRLLNVADNKIILISSYTLNLDLLEKILLEASAPHPIFFETYSDSSRKPFKIS